MKIESVSRTMAAERAVSKGARKWTRSNLYGRSRMNEWPLWIAWLLAPSKANRQIVSELRQIRRAGKP